MRNPIKSLSDFTKFAVNRADQMEVIRQTLYDFQAYPMAGASSLTFFSIPIGQSSKTKADTNMTIAGSLPAPIRFAIQAIEIYFFPGVFPSQAPAATAINAGVNDVWEVLSGVAWAELQIGSKPYLIEAPLLRFPPFARFAGFAGLSDSTTAGAAGFERTSYMSAAGRPYVVEPTLLLEPTQNFSFTLNFPTAIAISVAGRIGVVLNGVTARNSQ
jgi:hypothetical protein